MGCNCGKKTQQFQNLIKQSAPPVNQTAPPPKMSRAERIRLRGIRIAARNAEAERRRQIVAAAQRQQQNDKK